MTSPPVPNVSATDTSTDTSSPGWLDTLKASLIPLAIALTIYLLTTFLLLPLYRRHKARYAQYLPLDGAASLLPSSLTSSSSGQGNSGSLRDRTHEFIYNLVSPSRWARMRARNRDGNGVVDGRFDEEDRDFGVGDEELGSMEGGLAGTGVPPREAVVDPRRSARDRMNATRERLQAMRNENDESGRSDRRLSRELEEGFRDSSDEESVD